MTEHQVSPHVALAALIREARCHAWFSQARVSTRCYLDTGQLVVCLEMDVCGNEWHRFVQENTWWYGYVLAVRVVSGHKTPNAYEAFKRWLYRKVLEFTRG